MRLAHVWLKLLGIACMCIFSLSRYRTEPAQSELCVNRRIMHKRNPHAFDFILQIVDEYSDFLSAAASFRLAITSRSRFNARQKRPLQRLSFRVAEKEVHCLQYYPVAAHYIYIAFDVLPTHSILFEQCYQLRDCHKLQCLTIDFKIDFTDMHRAELRARISKYLPTHAFIGDILTSIFGCGTVVLAIGVQLRKVSATIPNIRFFFCMFRLAVNRNLEFMGAVNLVDLGDSGA